MTAREHWQALQTTLTAARTAVDRGDTAAALAAVDAALELDPNFLAAHSLRDRIVAGDLRMPRQAPVPAAPEHDSATAVELSPGPPVGNAATESPAEGYAKFEQRARRRRVDRRIDAARLAIEKKHVRRAALALDEVIELDPNLPELSELTIQFDQLRRSATGAHVGPWIAAGAVVAGSVFGATWLHESSPPLISRSVIAAMPLFAGQAPSASVASNLEPVATTDVTEIAEVSPRVPPVTARPVGLKPATVFVSSASTGQVEQVAAPRAVAPSPPPQQQPQPTPPQPAPPLQQQVPPQPPQPQAPAVAVPATPRPAPESVVAAVALVSNPPVPKGPDVDEHAMVAQTLQRYRSAYEGLDARSAHAVWPGVNQAALARAFDGLRSQRLTFDACDVRVSGEAATATCQGSARYVPKIGNREPRTESRVWNFVLHKTGADWTIDSARADRD
ncbi:MAG TPA: hypothetical protein VKE51_03745 [Vicinamibacterales bacterium]|nr:hypothetical protein [Vicinamibacterales bacterium]